MSIASLVANPKSYLRVHEVQLNGAGDNLVPTGMTRHAAVPNPAHGNSIQFTHVSNVTMNQGHAHGAKNVFARPLQRVGVAARRQVTYAPALGGSDAGFRILPWDGTNITFMQLDGGATFVVTGPLTGCTVGAVRHGGAVWLFHANVAGGGGVIHHATKRQMIQHAAAGVGVPGTAAFHYCEYGAGNDYDGLGFVWGRPRSTGDWKFYVHYIAPAALGGHGNQIGNAKWATV
jgi:hypothetical protein